MYFYLLGSSTSWHRAHWMDFKHVDHLWKTGLDFWISEISMILLSKHCDLHPNSWWWMFLLYLSSTCLLLHQKWAGCFCLSKFCDAFVWSLHSKVLEASVLLDFYKLSASSSLSLECLLADWQREYLSAYLEFAPSCSMRSSLRGSLVWQYPVDTPDSCPQFPNPSPIWPFSYFWRSLEVWMVCCYACCSSLGLAFPNLLLTLYQIGLLFLTFDSLNSVWRLEALCELWDLCSSCFWSCSLRNASSPTLLTFDSYQLSTLKQIGS